MMRSFLSFAALLLLLAVGYSTARSQHDFHTFHGAKGETKLDYDSLATAAAPLTKAPEGRALVEACLARYGGAERLRKLKGLRLTYQMRAGRSGEPVEVVKTFQPDRKHRVRLPDQTRTLNGDRATFRNASTELDLDGGRYRAELFSFLTLAMPLAMTTERFDGEVRYGTRQGDSLGYFYMDKKDSLLIVIGVDPEDSLIKSSEGVVRQGEQTFVFINRFSDHRDVEGIPFAHHLVNVSMGLEVGRSTLESVELDPSFGSSEFSP